MYDILYIIDHTLCIIYNIGWVYRGLCNSTSGLGNVWAVFHGHRESARVVPHPAPCELSSRRKLGSVGASAGAIVGAVVGTARPAGSSSRGLKPDIDCDYGSDRANIYVLYYM